MAASVVLILLLAMFNYSSATWCVCKQGESEEDLQKTLDYACGEGADCTSIHAKGACYNPDTVRDHCSYAANSYFQKKGQAQGSCDFSGTAIVTATDPSSSGCVYPSSASGTTTSPVNTNPSTTTPSSSTPRSPFAGTTTPVGGSPFLTTPTGIMSPSGAGINTDVSNGGYGSMLLGGTSFLSLLIILVVWGFMFFY